PGMRPGWLAWLPVLVSTFVQLVCELSRLSPRYDVSIDGTLIASGTHLDGSPIQVTLQPLENVKYNITLTASNGLGAVARDNIVITTTETPVNEFSVPRRISLGFLEMTTLFLLARILDGGTSDPLDFSRLVNYQAGLDPRVVHLNRLLGSRKGRRLHLLPADDPSGSCFSREANESSSAIAHSPFKVPG
ncbi:MAG: hypothetical protein JW839_17160, partial [Candidatus Lokiarchaeota archaeon]|nr:hypothetical protein [Candidatus Lokiarchaeota archaeon]